ncbi:MAG: TadE/TadG family type IV pilus assembly protein [Bryobacteraceae bacterium]
MSVYSNREVGSRRRRERLNGRRGAAIIEASLTLMLFLIFLFSLFDFGYVTFFHHTLMQHARAAARYGVVIDASTPENQTRIKNVLLFNNPHYAGGDATGLLGLDPSNVSVEVRPKSASVPVAQLVVTVRGYRYGLITPGFAGLHDGQTLVASLPMEYR